jgi:uncharacterized protein YndB with AHSA1/START domain
MPSDTDRVEKKVLLRAPLAKVWNAVSNAADFGRWFGVRFEGPFAPGAVLRGKIVPTEADADVAAKQKDFEGMPIEIAIERVEPERLFSFRWHPYAVERGVDYSHEPTTLVVFELQEAAGGVLLTVTESGFDRIPLARRAKAFASNEQGWSLQVGLIEKYVVSPAAPAAPGSLV